jgi:hypothetical protein
MTIHQRGRAFIRCHPRFTVSHQQNFRVTGRSYKRLLPIRFMHQKEASSIAKSQLSLRTPDPRKFSRVSKHMGGAMGFVDGSAFTV